MGSITIRNLDDSVKRKLRVRAAQHGRSMEEEARHILRAAVTERTPAPTNLYDAIRRHVAQFGGVDLEIPPREPMPERLPLVDTHAHLNDERFDADRAEVISRAAAVGLETIIAVGTTAEKAGGLASRRLPPISTLAGPGRLKNSVGSCMVTGMSALRRYSAMISAPRLTSAGLSRSWPEKRSTRSQAKSASIQS